MNDPVLRRAIAAQEAGAFPAAEAACVEILRDVIVTCFRTRFSLNAAMFQFVSLETAARYCVTVMSLAEAARKARPLSPQVVRYEDLTADLRGTTTRLVEFLGLPWSGEVLKYADEAQLAPVLSILDSWVRKFGYEVAG